MTRPFRFPVILLCALLSGCAHLVKISYTPEAVIHPAFDQSTMSWEGERVQVVVTPSLQGEPLKYLANYENAFLANSLRQRGLRRAMPLFASFGRRIAHRQLHHRLDGLFRLAFSGNDLFPRNSEAGTVK